MKPFIQDEYIANFIEVFLTDENQYTGIYGGSSSVRSQFVKALIDHDAFEKFSLLSLSLESSDTLENVLKDNSQEYTLLVIDNTIWEDIGDIRAVIKEYLPDSKVIFTSKENKKEKNTTYFYLPKMTFRDFLTSKNIEISIPQVLKGEYDISKLNTFKDEYILEDEEDFLDFSTIRANIEENLYKKDKEVFDEYLQVMASQVGNLHKENEIAKMMGISRRKIRKYTDLLLENGVLKEVFPFVENADVELSRHVKYFFSDLSYLHAILGDTYYKWLGKSAVIENFLYLELSQKLWETHTIYFWRKKSGTQIHFVLVNNENTLLTPVEIHYRSLGTISKAMKSFYDLYAEKVEHGMLFNEDIAKAMEFEGTSFLILPHIAI